MKNKLYRIISIVLVVIVIASAMSVAALAADGASTAGIVSLSSGRLNVRSWASTSAPILTSLPNGSYVTLISKSGNWWRVEYGKGQYGYCHGSYIKQVSGTYPAYVEGSLNVRSGPGTSYGVIGWLNSGEYAVVLSSSGKWKKVLFGGTRVGYASGTYLKTGGGYSAVSLNVPDYKQNDSRWAYTKVGSSGRTIGDIGCSTVALAMMESHRTGTNIYPNTMASRLKYTSGGAVYWPGNYGAYTGGDYLKFTYDKIKAGRPVMVGLKNSWGGQHWVVVKGYGGGSSLSASSFTVNDPGSWSRTNLQQVINVYPYFYKVMYY
ncbi:MAG TPA: SH3 domain-containing protein [Clostridiales bacterium]|nr:SH3 domain-containing protein [Clostridiales bacterium]